MRKFILIAGFSVIVIIGLLLFYLTVHGIKTNKFNNIINKKIKDKDPRISLELKDVYMKLNFGKNVINLNTKDPKLNIDNSFIDLLEINIELELVKFLKQESSINKIQLITEKNSVKRITNFLNSYKFNFPRFLIYNQIESGNIQAVINLNFSKEDKNFFNYEIAGMVEEANVNIFKKTKFNNINFNFYIKDKIYNIDNIRLKYEGVEFQSQQVKINNLGDSFKINGDIKHKRIYIDPNLILKLFDKNLDFLDDEKIFLESDNKFSFNLESNKSIKNLTFSSNVNFHKLFIKPKYQDLIFFKNGLIKTNYSNKNLDINIDSEFSFKNQGDSVGKENSISLNINKNNGKDTKVKVLLKNKSALINTKEFSKLFKFDQVIINDQNIILGSSNDINFILDKNNKIKDLKVKSVLNFDKLKLEFVPNAFFSKIKKTIPDFKDHIFLATEQVKIDYSKNKTEIQSKGIYSLKTTQQAYEDQFDKFQLELSKNKNKLDFDAKINLDNIKISSNEINYWKNKKIPAVIKISGTYSNNNKLKFKDINYTENKNQILISNLKFSNNYKIKDIDKVELNYLTYPNKHLNNLNIFKNKKNNNYELSSDNFDGREIVKNLTKGENKNSFLKIFKNLNSEIILNLNKFNTGNKSFLNKAKGKVIVENNKINYLKIDGFLNKNNKFSLNLKTTPDNAKVTNLYIKEPKPFIKNYKFIKGFEEGELSYDSIESNGLTKSKLKIYDFKVKEVPILAKILTLATFPSFQGILDLLTGEGLRFSELEMDYERKNRLTTINEMYAIGPSISILMEGYIEKDKLTSLKGTMVPATVVDKVINKIPLIGKILVGKEIGEGMFGVSFKIKGPPKKLKTTVNPIKTLTPRFITRTLKKLRKN